MGNRPYTQGLQGLQGSMAFDLAAFLALIPAIGARQAGGAAMMIAGLVVVLVVGSIGVRNMLTRWQGRSPGWLMEVAGAEGIEAVVAGEAVAPWPAPQAATLTSKEKSEMEQIAFLKESVVGVIDRREDIERCVEALKGAGFAQNDIHVIWGGKGGRGALPGWRAWPGHSVRVVSLVGDEGDVLEGYEEEWLAGHGSVAVRVRGPQEIEPAAAILAAHRGHHVKRFGKWSITDIPLGMAVTAGRQPRPVESPGRSPEGAGAGAVQEPQAADLAHVDIFQGLSREALGRIAAMGVVRYVGPGTLLTPDRASDGTFYAILSGVVAFSIASPKAAIPIRLAGPGESFPLAVLLGQDASIATAKARTSARVIEFPAGALLKLFEDDAATGAHVYGAIAGILAERYRLSLSRLTRAHRQALKEEDAFANV